MSDRPTVTIADFPEEQLESIVRWRNDGDVNKHMRPGYRSLESVRAGWQGHSSSEANTLLAILADGDLIGYCTIEHLDRDNKRCELGVVIGEKRYWRQGIGSTVIRMLCERAFLELQMHRVEAVIHEDNTASIRCFSRVGFREEGRLRQAKYANGEYRDVLLYGLLRSEFDVARGASNNWIQPIS